MRAPYPMPKGNFEAASGVHRHLCALRAPHRPKRVERHTVLTWIAIVLALLGNVVAATALSMTILQTRTRVARHRAKAGHPASTAASGNSQTGS